MSTTRVELSCPSGTGSHLVYYRGTSQVSFESCATPDGTLHGPAASYAPDGSLSSRGQFRDGLETGAWAWWTAGQLSAQGHYLNGVKHGEWLDYLPDGRLFSRHVYVHGEVDSYVFYDDVLGDMEGVTPRRSQPPRREAVAP